VRQHHRTEQGATSITQTVIVAPALLFALMLIVQFGLMFHAANVAENAAQQGAAAARRFYGTEAAARTRAGHYLASVNGTLSDTAVTVHRTAQSASVTVTGTVVPLVPWVRLHVAETASGPVERYVPPTGDAGGRP
jgi:Flp pilus assembly protein TadG